MHTRNRWALLEHRGSPEDLNGCHYDLLLEDHKFCRTWRLSELPPLDGSMQEAIPLPLHKLEWLEKTEGPVSRKRGWAKRIMAGFYIGVLPVNQ